MYNRTDRDKLNAIFNMLSALTVKLTGQKPICVVEDGRPDRIIHLAADESRIIFRPVKSDAQEPEHLAQQQARPDMP